MRQQYPEAEYDELRVLYERDLVPVHSRAWPTYFSTLSRPHVEAPEQRWFTAYNKEMVDASVDHLLARSTWPPSTSMWARSTARTSLTARQAQQA